MNGNGRVDNCGLKGSTSALETPGRAGANGYERIDSHGLICSKSDLDESRKTKATDAAIWTKPRSRHARDPHVWHKLRHEPIFFCSSLVKSDPP